MTHIPISQFGLQGPKVGCHPWVVAGDSLGSCYAKILAPNSNLGQTYVKFWGVAPAAALFRQCQWRHLHTYLGLGRHVDMRQTFPGTWVMIPRVRHDELPSVKTCVTDVIDSVQSVGKFCPTLVWDWRTYLWSLQQCCSLVTSFYMSRHFPSQNKVATMSHQSQTGVINMKLQQCLVHDVRPHRSRPNVMTSVYIEMRCLTAIKLRDKTAASIKMQHQDGHGKNVSLSWIRILNQKKLHTLRSGPIPKTGIKWACLLLMLTDQ